MRPDMGVGLRGRVPHPGDRHPRDLRERGMQRARHRGRSVALRPGVLEDMSVPVNVVKRHQYCETRPQSAIKTQNKNASADDES